MPIITTHNAETGEVETREMNTAEFAQYEKDLVDAEARQEATALKTAEKQQILDQLGITAEQARLLLS